MRILSVIILFLTVSTSVGQDKAFLANSNYAPTSSVYLNPSSMSDSKTWLDINLVGFGAMAHNNYLYIPNSHLSSLLKSDNITVNDRYNNRRNQAIVSSNIQGPGFTLQIKDHSFGLNTSIRSITNANRIPSELSKLIFEDLNYTALQNQDYSMKNGSVDHMTWGEIGLSYSKLIYKKGVDLIAVGGTLKRLYGFSSAGLKINDLSYRVPNDSTLSATSYNGAIYYSEPNIGFPGKIQNKGWGLDLGFTYKRMLSSVSGYTPHSESSNCEQKAYKFKFGVSLLDLGAIKFDTQTTHRTYSSGQGEVPLEADDNFESIAANTDALVTEAGSSNDKTSYLQHLPSSLSVQFDYNLGRGLYANAVVTQSVLPSKLTGVIRPNTLTAGIRYESKWLELGVPVTLYDYRYPTVGFMLRLYNVTIGTDHLIPFIAKSDIYRADIYASIKIPFFKSPQCRGKRSGGRKGGSPDYKGGLIDCPSF